ncbi:hypothetical protein ACFL47_00650 [Candidatus Latescibacterota bacterium]
MQPRLILILTTATLLSAAAVTGQIGRKTEEPVIEGEPLRFRAPRTEYEYGDSAFVKSYSGGVFAWRNDVEVEADTAIYLSDVAEARFYGSTTFRDSIRRLSADTLIYFYKINEAIAIGNVVVIEENRLFRSGRVRYRKDQRSITAANSVYVRDDSVNSIMKGDTAVFNDSTGYGLITGYPVLIREDEGGEIIMVSCDDSLEIHRDKRIMRLWNNVVVTSDSLRVTSVKAEYDDSLEVITLVGKPEARHVIFHNPDDAVSEIKTVSTVSGDSMWVYLDERRVSGVDVIGKAHSTTLSADSTGATYDESIITSSAMRLLMNERKISRISAEGTADSYYHKANQEDDNMIVNKATGDTIYFFFDVGKITHMRITGAGGAGAKGTYYGFKPEPDSTVAPE